MGRILACSVSVKSWRSQAYYDKDEWQDTTIYGILRREWDAARADG